LILGASPIFPATLSRRSRSRYSRRLQLIQAYTRGEPDFNTLSRRSSSRYSRRLQLIQAYTLASPMSSSDIMFKLNFKTRDQTT
ncbi:hypothetical protein GIB67_043168, partial [Kingdonia uniflora]